VHKYLLLISNGKNCRIIKNAQPELI